MYLEKKTPIGFIKQKSSKKVLGEWYACFNDATEAEKKLLRKFSNV
jgi:hypothetical protein